MRVRRPLQPTLKYVLNTVVVSSQITPLRDPSETPDFAGEVAIFWSFPCCGHCRRNVVLHHSHSAPLASRGRSRTVDPHRYNIDMPPVDSGFSDWTIPLRKFHFIFTHCSTHFHIAAPLRHLTDDLKNNPACAPTPTECFPHPCPPPRKKHTLYEEWTSHLFDWAHRTTWRHPQFLVCMWGMAPACFS